MRKQAKLKELQQKRFADSAQGRLQASDQLMEAARARAVTNLPVVTVKFPAGERIGVKLDDSLTVVDVEKDGRAYTSLRVGDGFVVRQLRIDGGEWQSPRDARITDGDSFDEFCGCTMAAFEIEFEREPPPKLFQGLSF